MAIKEVQHFKTYPPLKIPEAILENLEPPRKKRRYIRKDETLYNANKISIYKLYEEIDILINIFRHLDAASSISLALTNKFFAGLAGKYNRYMNTILSDAPTPIQIKVLFPKNETPRKNNEDRLFHKRAYLHSSRRTAMLHLSKSMRKGYRLCWMCSHFKPTANSQWHKIRYANRVSASNGYTRHCTAILKPFLPDWIWIREECCGKEIEFVKDREPEEVLRPGVHYDWNLIDCVRGTTTLHYVTSHVAADTFASSDDIQYHFTLRWNSSLTWHTEGREMFNRSIPWNKENSKI